VLRLVSPAPLVLALLAFALRVYALDRQSLWYDEGFSAFLASLPLREVPQHGPAPSAASLVAPPVDVRGGRF
jgi:hypothetical protein